MSELDKIIKTLGNFDMPKLHKTARHKGDKTSPKCPFCQNSTYGYHDFNFKDCTTCGYDRYLHPRLKQMKKYIKNNQRAELKNCMPLLRQLVTYVNRLKRYKEESGKNE